MKPISGLTPRDYVWIKHRVDRGSRQEYSGSFTVWLAESFVVGFLAGVFYGHVLWDK